MRMKNLSLVLLLTLWALASCQKVAYGTYTSDGDVVEDVYRADSTDSKKTLIITHLDLNNKRVEGTFHVSFLIKEPRINAANPRKVTFSGGRFWAVIRD